MQPNRRLSDNLPIRFASGEQVRQFSKPCVHCGKMLDASCMQGVARLVGDQIAIAAKAHCPSCGARFPIVCLIDEDKRVRRVVLPYWLFNFYLRLIADDPLPESARPQPDATVSAVPAPQAVSEPVELSEESVGRYQGRPIPAWVRVNGRQLVFARIAPQARAGEGEFLLDGCLLYRRNA